MPEPAQPGKILHGGEFYSPVQARLSTGDVLLSELRQPSPRVVPRHEHALAYVTVVLGGHYQEGDRGHLDEMPPLTAVFNPVGVAHSTVIGPAGASLFTIEFRSEAMRALDVLLPGETTFDAGVGTMLWPGLRLFSAFKASAGSLELESHIFELLAAIARVASERRARENYAPRWFRRVKERLHAEFREHLRMGDLARDAGVHPVHLARVFRKFEKRTPGEYQQRLQVRAACELLRDPEWPLAAIAAECGFSDQSHLTRVFRRMAATTPARFRRTVVAKPLAA